MSLRHKIRLLALFNFFDAFRFSGAILVIYFARVSGSYALGMSVFSINSISQLVFDVPTGLISDALGRKPVTHLRSDRQRRFHPVLRHRSKLLVSVHGRRHRGPSACPV